MPILFSAVACENNILLKFASCDGNFTEIVEQALEKLPPSIGKMTYFHGKYLLHYILENKHVFFCVTDKTCQRSRAFLFLNEIQRRFTCKAKEDFTSVLAGEMYRYSEDYSTITIRKGELDELNNIGVDSSEAILGEKILYVNNPDNVSYSIVSYVGKEPERISISVESSQRLYVIIVGLLMILIGTVYIVSPISCIAVTTVVVLSLIRSFVYPKNKSD